MGIPSRFVVCYTTTDGVRADLHAYADGDGPEMVRAVAQCSSCGERFVSPTFGKSRIGELTSRHVQDVFPDWSPADRELCFMSGICGACWAKMTAPSEDSDEKA